MAKKKQLIRGLRRSPRLNSPIKKTAVLLPKAAKEITKKKLIENGGKTLQRLECFARGSEASGFLRRSPRLKNVSCDLKPQAVLKKKSAKLGKSYRVKQVLEPRVAEVALISSSSEVEVLLKETELFQEAIRVLSKGLANKRRSERKRRELGFDKLIMFVENTEIANKEKNSEDYSELKFQEKSTSFEGSKQFINCYKRKLRENESGSKAINSTDSPNGDSSSAIQETSPSKPTNISQTDININSKTHTNEYNTDPNPQVLVSESIENGISTFNVGPGSIVPYTPSPSKSNYQPNYQISEPDLITDSAKTAFNESCLVGPGTPGPSVEVKTDLITYSVPKYSFNIGNGNSNMGPSSMVHDAPGPSNPTKTSVTNSNVGPSLVVHGAPGPSSKGFILRKARSPRFLRFKIRDKECNAQSVIVKQSGFVKGCFENRVDLDQNSSQKIKFLCNSADEKSAVEDPDWNQNKYRLKTRLSDEKTANMGGTILKKRGRDTTLHRLVFEEGGLPDGTELTYRTNNKILLTGYKQGDCIVCACHDIAMRPSQFEAHAGMAQRRKPYHHIYTSDGNTLHDLCLELAKIRKPISEVQVKFKISHRDYSPKVRIIPTNNKLIRVLETLKGIIISCSICKDISAAIGDENHSKLIIFCNQCGKAYHVGCLDNKESFNIEDVFNKSWFCCTDCTWIHTSLKNLCTNDPNPVPSSFLEFLKGQKNEENSLNIEWQIFSGKNTKDEMLLIQALQLLKSAFKPIYEERNLIQSMVFGKEVIGKGLDFNGMLCIAIKVNEEIVCIALLRVFGQFVAEIPLATTSKIWRRKGYFKMLLSLIEELLGLLKVRLIVAPVHDKMQSIWIDKFGFVKSTDQKVQMLREQHAIMVFEETDILEKEIPVQA